MKRFLKIVFVFSASILAGDFYGPNDSVAKIDYSLNDLDITVFSIWIRTYKQKLSPVAFEGAPEGKISFIDYLHSIRNSEIRGQNVPNIDLRALEINEKNKNIWYEGMKDFEWIFNNNDDATPLSVKQCQGYQRQFEQIGKVVSGEQDLSKENGLRCTIS